MSFNKRVSFNSLFASEIDPLHPRHLPKFESPHSPSANLDLDFGYNPVRSTHNDPSKYFKFNDFNFINQNDRLFNDEQNQRQFTQEKLRKQKLKLEKLPSISADSSILKKTSKYASNGIASGSGSPISTSSWSVGKDSKKPKRPSFSNGNFMGHESFSSVYNKFKNEDQDETTLRNTQLNINLNPDLLQKALNQPTKRKKLTEMTNEEILALDQQVRPTSSDAEYKSAVLNDLSNQIELSKFKTLANSLQGPSPESHVLSQYSTDGLNVTNLFNKTYPTRPVVNHRSFTCCVQHADFEKIRRANANYTYPPSDTLPACLLSTALDDHYVAADSVFNKKVLAHISGRKHTWDAVCFLFQQILSNGDEIVVFSNVGSSKIDKVPKAAQVLLKSLETRAQTAGLVLKISVEICVDGPLHDIEEEKEKKEYHHGLAAALKSLLQVHTPDLVVVGSKHSSLSEVMSAHHHRSFDASSSGSSSRRHSDTGERFLDGVSGNTSASSSTNDLSLKKITTKLSRASTNNSHYDSSGLWRAFTRHQKVPLSEFVASRLSGSVLIVPSDDFSEDPDDELDELDWFQSWEETVNGETPSVEFFKDMLSQASDKSLAETLNFVGNSNYNIQDKSIPLTTRTKRILANRYDQQMTHNDSDSESLESDSDDDDMDKPYYPKVLRHDNFGNSPDLKIQFVESGVQPMRPVSKSTTRDTNNDIRKVASGLTYHELLELTKSRTMEKEKEENQQRKQREEKSKSRGSKAKGEKKGFLKKMFRAK